LAPVPVIAHINGHHEREAGVLDSLDANPPNQIRLIVPEPLQSNTLTLESHKLEVIFLYGARPELKAVVGSILMNGDEHVWMANIQTPSSRQQWINMLDKIDALYPKVVVP